MRYEGWLFFQSTFQVKLRTKFVAFHTGDLNSLLDTQRKTGVPFPEAQIWSVTTARHWPLTVRCMLMLRCMDVFRFLFSQVCDALRTMHSCRVMHRDIKPGNIFLTESRQVKLGRSGSRQILQVRLIQSPHSLFLSPCLT